MGKVPRIPTYLYQTSSGYIFRFNLPCDIEPLFGKSELRYSLKTSQRGKAIRRARTFASGIQRIIISIRKGGRMSGLTVEQINEIVREYFQNALDEDESERVTRRMLNPDQHHERLMALDYGKTLYREELGTSEYSRIAQTAERLLHEKRMEFERDSEMFRLLCRKLLQLPRFHSVCDF